MSALSSSQRVAQQARSSAWWLIPAAALAAVVGWEIDWGRHPVPEPPPATPVAAKPVEAAVLPEYRLEGGLAARTETVNRTLFNATRRPAPALAGGAGSRRLQAGQFVLVGTTVSGEQRIAFLKETNGGKSHTVRQGDQINGMEVTLVAADHVRLLAGGDSEELSLKVARGPKTTLPPPAPTASAPPAAAAEQPAPQPAPVQVAPARSAEETAAARREARRASAAGGQAGQAAGGAQAANGNPTSAGPTPKVDPNASPPGTWSSVYENMRRNRQQ